MDKRVSQHVFLQGLSDEFLVFAIMGAVINEGNASHARTVSQDSRGTPGRAGR
jgi:hypothetical protein